jgi:hypothetical protein
LITVTGFVKTDDNPTPLPLALVPLVSYTTSLIFSIFFYKAMMKAFRNRFIPLFISIIIISAASLPLFVRLTNKTNKNSS